MTWLLPSRSQPKTLTRGGLLFFRKSNFVTCAGFQLPFCLDLYLVSDFDGSRNPKKISFYNFSCFKLTFVLDYWLDFFSQDLKLKLSPEACYWIFEIPTSLLAQVSNFRFVCFYTWCPSFYGSKTQQKKLFQQCFPFQTHFRPRLLTWLLPSRSQPKIFNRGGLLVFWKSNFVTCAGFQPPFCLDL